MCNYAIMEIKNGQFKKGYKHTKEWKKQKSEQMKDNMFWDNSICKKNQFKKGHKGWNKGMNDEKRICIKCKKEFVAKKRDKKKYCSKECYWKDLKNISRGEDNAFYDKKHSDKTREQISKERKGKALWKGLDNHNTAKKEKHWNWQDGKSKEKYGEKFNRELKQQIRKRDNYRCADCGISEKELVSKKKFYKNLDIHHLDEDKKNNNKSNLISLCRSCHLARHGKKI